MARAAAVPPTCAKKIWRWTSTLPYAQPSKLLFAEKEAWQEKRDNGACGGGAAYLRQKNMAVDINTTIRAALKRGAAKTASIGMCGAQGFRKID